MTTAEAISAGPNDRRESTPSSVICPPGCGVSFVGRHHVAMFRRLGASPFWNRIPRESA
jgi:hypothetical protein